MSEIGDMSYEFLKEWIYVSLKIIIGKAPAIFVDMRKNGICNVNSRGTQNRTSPISVHTCLKKGP